MSRTKPRGGTASPIKKYLQFSGSTGVFSFYDREAKERVELDELKITVVDVRSSISGYNSSNKSQITSNIVAETTKDPLKVVAWKGGKPTDVAEGLYKEIKSKVKDAGGKFTTNVLCLTDVGNGRELCNLQLSGSSLNGWINFIDTLEAGGEYDNEITITKGALSKVDGNEFVEVSEKEEKALIAKIKKNPRTPQPVWFYVMSLDTEELTEEQAEEADEADKKLQAYFEALDGKDAKSTPAKGSVSDSPEDEEDEDDAEEDEEADGKVPF